MLARVTCGLPGRGLRKGHAGFTLIELMIVIAVIMILAAILIPQFAVARERAKKASCVSNQRNIETAVSMWTTDNPMPIFGGGTFNVSTPSYSQVTGAGGGTQYSVAGAFIEPDHNGLTNGGADYYLSNGSASGAVASANPSAPSYGHVACAYTADVNATGCTPGDPWVNCYNGGGPATGLSHARGTSASP
jgi:prepilin-type N-terminal cleavage/methylation domain-containing protein